MWVSWYKSLFNGFFMQYIKLSELKLISEQQQHPFQWPFHAVCKRTFKKKKKLWDNMQEDSEICHFILHIEKLKKPVIRVYGTI